MSYITSYNEKINSLIQITTPESPFSLQSIKIGDQEIPKFTRELWTSRQRQAHSLHEVSYRACFKPQLPNYFIQKFTRKDDVVYDPFSGRGTTIVEAALMGRRVIANDINPVSAVLSRPRLNPPGINEVSDRLKLIPRIPKTTKKDIDLSMFFHEDTFGEIIALREYFEYRKRIDSFDSVDAWIQMVALNRLTGHSPGFFSVYTLPPNQATTPERQQKINLKYGTQPEKKDTHQLIIKKTRQLISDLGEEKENLVRTSKSALFLSCDARKTDQIEHDSVRLVVTSPPFLDIVQYASDNWLRCWFLGLNVNEIDKAISTPRSLDVWLGVMRDVFTELRRVLMRDGYIAFEVGEIRKGTIRLEDEILPLGIEVGLEPIGILINEQVFTKTAHIWGVDNNASGTNSNRIALFRKP